MPTPTVPLMQILSRDVLLRLAGERSFERGKNYWLKGYVRSFVLDGGRVIAKVVGTDDYRVELWVGNPGLGYSCTCPVNDDGSFCKHCVAVGLKLIADEQSPCADGKSHTVTMDDVRTYLRNLGTDALIELIVDQARDDDHLRDLLLMKAAGRKGPGVELSPFEDALRNAVASDGFVEYREMYAYTRGIEDVVDSIEELLDEGHAAEVVELTESALAIVEEAANSVDDSGGSMGEILCRLQDIHLFACEKCRPDPEKLAKRLFELELENSYDVFSDAAETYADVLGEKGLEVYRQLVVAEWERIRPSSPGEKDEHKYGRQFRITRMMEALAAQDITRSHHQ